MTVLAILGILIAVAFLYWLVNKINEITYEKYKFELFRLESLILIAISYGLLIWGVNWYFDEVNKINGDILNGIILFLFGSIGILLNLIMNIKKSSFFIGIFLTFIQLILYIPMIAALGLFLLGALVFFSETKPVYNIN